MKRITKIVSRKKHGFELRPLHQKREPHPVFFLSQRGSFWVATLSVLAFVMGNMVGQHGWYLFWASVLGKEEVVYTGTVSPVHTVPDYALWHQYGGDQNEHLFRQVPSDALQPLPLYTQSASVASSVYSVSYMGTYTGDPEGSGSHPGVDIRVPVGTPIVSIANGIVEEVKSGGGFGNVVVVRHPNVPDPENPNSTTTLYSSYAHLDSSLVSVGMIVSKGEQIGLSGKTGFASGPHLHFQIDREEAPWHPYWPFSTAEQNAAGMTLVEAVNAGLNIDRGFRYTVSPMLYVQSNYAPVEGTTTIVLNPMERLLTSVEQRRLARLERTSTTTVAFHSAASSEPSSSSFSSSQKREPISAPAVQEIILSPILRAQQAQADRHREREAREIFVNRQTENTSPIVSKEDVVSTDENSGLQKTTVHDVRVEHDGFYSGRGWEVLTVQLIDKNQNVIKNPDFDTDLYMRTSYGEAEFRPSILTPADFVNGEAIVHMLPRGRRTVVIQARPYQEQSDPMVYQRVR